MLMGLVHDEAHNCDKEVAKLENNKEYFYGESGWYAEGIITSEELSLLFDEEEERKALSSPALYALLEKLTKDSGGMIPIPANPRLSEK